MCAPAHSAFALSVLVELNGDRWSPMAGAQRPNRTNGGAAAGTRRRTRARSGTRPDLPRMRDGRTSARAARRECVGLGGLEAQPLRGVRRGGGTADLLRAEVSRWMACGTRLPGPLR